MKAVLAAFNQEKALVGAFSVIVQPVVEPMEHYTALHLTLIMWLICIQKMNENMQEEVLSKTWNVRNDLTCFISQMRLVLTI